MSVPLNRAAHAMAFQGKSSNNKHCNPGIQHTTRRLQTRTKLGRHGYECSKWIPTLARSEWHVTVPVMATSEVSQFECNDHHHSIHIARLHTKHGKLRIGIVQVENCQLPKDFSGPPIGDRALVRKFIEGWSRACCCLLNFVIK
jgi:hypothetical protein